VKLKSYMRLAACVALALMVSYATPVRGALLAPASVLIPGAAEPDPVGATLLFSTGAVPFAVPGSFSGTLTSSVYSPDPSNPLLGVTLTYLITNDAASANSIGRFTVDGYSGWGTDGSYQTPVAGVAPASIDRNVSGDVIGYNFVPTGAPATGFLIPGGSSALLVVQTDAPSYTAALGSLIDGGVTTVPSLGPAVPEPSTIALVLGGWLAWAYIVCVAVKSTGLSGPPQD